MTKLTPVFFKPQYLYIVNNNNNIIMAVIYVPDDLVSKIITSGKNKAKFVKEAIEEKLKREI